jgi:hypothetical protein
MTLRSENALQRCRVLTLDGGPSTPVVIRIIQKLEHEYPGFVDRVDMFAGTSDGAMVSLFMAHSLSQGLSGRETIDRCIEFHDEVIQAFQFTPVTFLRAASGLFSAYNDSRLGQVLSKYLGDATLKDLSRQVSIAAYNASDRVTATFQQATARDMRLVDVALASSALMPLMPAFRDQEPSAGDYQDKLMFDGAMASNSPILSALADAIEYLRQRGNDVSSRAVGQLGIGPVDPSAAADGLLQSLTMLSMGSEVSRVKLLQALFNVPWPPFGLRKNKKLFQYGFLWSLASNVVGLAATMIQREASDEVRLSTQLLGTNRFHRYAPLEQGAGAVLGLLLDTRKTIREAVLKAEELWIGPASGPLRRWAEQSWMKDPDD